MFKNNKVYTNWIIQLIMKKPTFSEIELTKWKMFHVGKYYLLFIWSVWVKANWNSMYIYINMFYNVSNLNLEPTCLGFYILLSLYILSFGTYMCYKHDASHPRLAIKRASWFNENGKWELLWLCQLVRSTHP